MLKEKLVIVNMNQAYITMNWKAFYLNPDLAIVISMAKFVTLLAK